MSQWQQSHSYGGYDYQAEVPGGNANANGQYQQRQVYRPTPADQGITEASAASFAEPQSGFAPHQPQYNRPYQPKNTSPQYQDVGYSSHSQQGAQQQVTSAKVNSAASQQSNPTYDQQQYFSSQPPRPPQAPQSGSRHTYNQAQQPANIQSQHPASYIQPQAPPPSQQDMKGRKPQNFGQRSSNRQQDDFDFGVSGYSYDSGYSYNGDSYESGYAQSTPSSYGSSASYAFKTGSNMGPTDMGPIRTPPKTELTKDFDYRQSYVTRPSTSYHRGFGIRFRGQRNISFRGRGNSFGRPPRGRPGEEMRRNVSRPYPPYNPTQQPRKRKEFGAGALPPPGTKNPTQLLYELKRGVVFGEYESGVDENQRFKISLTIDGISFSGFGATKKKAKGDACKRALAQLYDYHYPEDPSEEVVETGSVDVKKAKLDVELTKGKNPSMLLHEISDTMEVTFVGYPKVQYARLSDEEKKTICLADEYVCQVKTNGKIATGSGSSKKLAKSRAAENGLKEYFNITLPAAAPPVVSADSAKDTDQAAPAVETTYMTIHPVSWLLQYDPAISFKIEPVDKSQLDPTAKPTSCPFFQCSVTMGENVFLGAIKTSKKDAKYSAAVTARDQILVIDPQAGQAKKKRKINPKPTSTE